MKKVNSKKELEKQGYARIDFNKGYWNYFEGEPDMPKYVLVSLKDDYTFNKGGDSGLQSTPCNSIKEALSIYNKTI